MGCANSDQELNEKMFTLDEVYDLLKLQRQICALVAIKNQDELTSYLDNAVCNCNSPLIKNGL